jgi:hypothetical protein
MFKYFLLFFLFCTFSNATSHNVELIKEKTNVIIEKTKEKTNSIIEKTKEISKEEIKQVIGFQKKQYQEGKEQNKRNLEKLKSFFQKKTN